MFWLFLVLAILSLWTPVSDLAPVPSLARCHLSPVIGFPSGFT